MTVNYFCVKNIAKQKLFLGYLAASSVLIYIFFKFLPVIYSDILEEIPHCSWYNFTVAERLNPNIKYEPITLATHASSNFAYKIIQQAKHWDDFVSFSILLPMNHPETVMALQVLHECYPDVREKVSFHLIWMGTEFCEKPFTLSDISCLNADSTIQILNNNKDAIFPYPINLMRNAARKGAATRLHIVADVENIFSKDFAVVIRKDAQRLLTPDHEKDLLVFRRFELEDGANFPQNNIDAYWLFKSQKMIEFHNLFYAKGHKIPNITEWMEASISNKDISETLLSYNRSNWEPQFIMNGNTPLHLSKVPTRNRDHQTFVNELCRANYTFKLLSHVFNIHCGIKTKNSIAENEASAIGIKNSRRFFAKFNAYLDAKYPGPTNCPRIQYWFD